MFLLLLGFLLPLLLCIFVVSLLYFLGALSGSLIFERGQYTLTFGFFLLSILQSSSK